MHTTSSAGGTFDGRGNLLLSSESAHLLFQKKMLAKIGTGQLLRGAFKVFGPTREGIGLSKFKSMLTNIGMNLGEEGALRLFARYDDDGSGHIDMYELMRNLMPRDYKGRTKNRIFRYNHLATALTHPLTHTRTHSCTKKAPPGRPSILKPSALPEKK